MKFMENPKWYWLRWIGIFPSAIIMSCVAYLIIEFVNRFYSDPDSWNMTFFTPLLASLISGIAFTGTAKYIAPSYKDVVSIVFIAIFILIAGCSLMLTLQNKDYFKFSKYVLSVVGAIFGHFIYKEETI
jgi:ABC-type iron transport system FetAB permease component